MPRGSRGQNVFFTIIITLKSFFLVFFGFIIKILNGHVKNLVYFITQNPETQIDSQKDFSSFENAIHRINKPF